MESVPIRQRAHENHDRQTNISHKTGSGGSSGLIAINTITATMSSAAAEPIKSAHVRARRCAGAYGLVQHMQMPTKTANAKMG